MFAMIKMAYQISGRLYVSLFHCGHCINPHFQTPSSAEQWMDFFQSGRYLPVEENLNCSPLPSWMVMMIAVVVPHLWRWCTQYKTIVNNFGHLRSWVAGVIDILYKTSQNQIQTMGDLSCEFITMNGQERKEKAGVVLESWEWDMCCIFGHSVFSLGDISCSSWPIASK